jgi:uncharacterized protein YtpQ (UPF0354 family)
VRGFVLSAVLGIWFWLACAKPPLTPSEFTRAYAAALHSRRADLKVTTVRDLELNISTEDGTFAAVQPLDRIYYDLYLQEPERKDEIIEHLVTVMLEAVKAPSTATAVDAARIVPVVKRRDWLDGRAGMLHEDLSPDLVVVYAEDRPNTTNYLFNDKLQQTGIAGKNLRSLAAANLLRLFPVRHHDFHNGSFMLTSGGNYEASLILADSILKQYQAKVDGSLIVAIPAADMFLLTGSKSTSGLSHVKTSLATIQKENAEMTLTTGLFIYKDGRLSVWAPEPGQE